MTSIRLTSNFQPLEVVDRGSETQLQAVENILEEQTALSPFV